MRVDLQADFLKYYSKLHYIDRGFLTQNNKEVLLKAWGRQDCCFTSEYRYYIWRRVVEGHVFFVLTGNRGTSLEAVGMPPKGLSVKLAKELLALARAEA